MDIYRFIYEFKQSSYGKIEASKKDVYKYIKALFPLRISVSPEFKHTDDETRKNLHCEPRTWHYDEILERIKNNTTLCISIEYNNDNDIYIFMKKG
jgi:hypothetical protein